MTSKDSPKMVSAYAKDLAVKCSSHNKEVEKRPPGKSLRSLLPLNANAHRPLNTSECEEAFNVFDPAKPNDFLTSQLVHSTTFLDA